ncbi:MAG: acylphosphatase [Candidatus Woesearchaeota archaeon]
MKRVKLVVHGRVQGVGYRDFVRITAQKLNIAGYVKNLVNRTAEIVAEGEESKLKVFVRECKRGSLMSRIEGVDESYEEPTGEFEYFLIEY